VCVCVCPNTWSNQSFAFFLSFFLSFDMAFVCAGCGSQIGSKSNYTRHLKRCARALEIEEDYILTPLPGLDELDREIWPSSDSPSFSPSVTTPSPSSSRKRGRPTKPQSQQSPRTEQNKKARFAKEVREVEKKHERSVSDLPAQAASSTLTSKIVDIYQNLPPQISSSTRTTSWTL